MTDPFGLERLMQAVERQRHDPSSEWFWAEVALLADRWDVLRHPFYQRWSAGQLRPGELATYAGEYDHLVVAIAAASCEVASEPGAPFRAALIAHAAEEEQHVDLWREFARAVGWDGSCGWWYGEDAFPETLQCAQTWSGDDARSLTEHLITLYAIESAQPRISTTKLEGLVEHYGFARGPATEYFRLHARLDESHAALTRKATERLLPDADPFALLAQVECTYGSYWQLLDRLEAEARA